MLSPAPAPMRSLEIDIPLDQIDWGDRLRDVNQSVAAEIAISVNEVDLIQPITVRPKPGGEGEGRYEGRAGLHRYVAHQLLQRSTIRCRVRALSDLDARQIEVDENLVRGELNPLDFMRFVAERLEIYAERHPEDVVPVEGASGRGRGRPPKNFLELRNKPGHCVRAVMGFAEETAKNTKLSRAKIYNAIQAYAGLTDDLRKSLAGTPIAQNEGLLRQLAALGDKVEQSKVADLLISGAAKTVPEAQARAAGNEPMKAPETPVDEAVKGLLKLWGAASPSARAAFLHDLAGRSLPKGYAISTPEAVDG